MNGEEIPFEAPASLVAIRTETYDLAFDTVNQLGVVADTLAADLGPILSQDSIDGLKKMGAIARRVQALLINDSGRIPDEERRDLDEL